MEATRMTCPCESCRTATERYFVYICRGRTGALYTGISTEPVRRVREHNTSKRGAKWARSQRPVILVWYEGKFTKSVALKFERKLKKLGRQQKLAFIRGDLPVEIPE
jgi:putative endonuclease